MGMEKDYMVKGLKQHPVLATSIAGYVKKGKLKLGKPQMNVLGESAPHLNANSGKAMKPMSPATAKKMLTTQTAKGVSGGASGRAPQPLVQLLTTSGPKRSKVRTD